jgi:anti-sigma factor RsiW
MMCPEPQRLQGYFDGELDAAEAAQLESHVHGCPQCQAELRRLEVARSALRERFAGVRAPQSLRASIGRALDAQEQPLTRPARAAGAPWRRPFWLGMLGGIGGSAIAAALAFLLLLTPQGSLLDQLVTAHVHSLTPGRLIAVVSTDRHTVKPWFAGRTDVSPVVLDFADQGYRLVGGRTDTIDRQRAAVVVYQHGAHFINVFSWRSPAGAPPADTTRSGYHLGFWKTGDLVYCAVSDTGWSELQGLEQLLQSAGEREQRP